MNNFKLYWANVYDEKGNNIHIKSLKYRLMPGMKEFDTYDEANINRIEIQKNNNNKYIKVVKTNI